ncbi:hypothetical protein ACJMK2_011240 [Sinanodonta woodiana]|uniref:Uncharacterized protein n=1 Tax=Sinanodonta woodiana TaxID=1069815 RepID=A0ABD3V4B8_SINWO
MPIMNSDNERGNDSLPLEETEKEKIALHTQCKVCRDIFGTSSGAVRSLQRYIWDIFRRIENSTNRNDHPNKEGETSSNSERKRTCGKKREDEMDV